MDMDDLCAAGKGDGVPHTAAPATIPETLEDSLDMAVPHPEPEPFPGDTGCNKRLKSCSKSPSGARSSPSPGVARRPTVGHLARSMQKPVPLRGIEWWFDVIWDSHLTCRLKLPEQPSFPVTMELQCAGMVGELLGPQADPSDP